MKCVVTAAALVLLTTPVLAQSSSTSSSSQSSQANQNASDNGSSANATGAEKLKQTLEHEGFTDVKVVARSFVVQGKSPDGDPVVMTIGPHGMSVFEAENETGSRGTTGSTGNTTGSSTTNPSASSNSRMQK